MGDSYKDMEETPQNVLCIEETPQSAEVIEKEKIRISVRSLVEFVFRSGDIDNRIGKGVQMEAMQQGSRMHRRIQKRMGAEYRAEVSLKHELIMGHYVLSVEGRADGVFRKEMSGEIFIDEIKCMYTDVTCFERPLPVHLAQAKCYAYIFAAQNGLGCMGVQITYCDLETENIRRFEELFTFEQLCSWFDGLIKSYRKWTDHQYEWRQIRRDSMKLLDFPLPWREGQKKLAGDVYRTIARKKILFLQAPTGTGKTIATVFPAVKAVGEGLADKIFYLTAKTITRTAAGEAFALLKEAGCRMKVLTVTAKEKLCPLDVMECNPAHCDFAKGHYDRVNEAVYELMTTAHDYTREVLLAQAEKYRVCPFEMALDLSLWSDAVICDYNYVFDPNIYLKRFFAEGEKGDYLFLIDEAHNLVERGREMYSATLVKEDFLAMKRIFRTLDKTIASGLDRCNRQLLEWKRECEQYRIHESIGSFMFSLMQLMSRIDGFLRRRTEFPERKEVTEFYLNLRHFMNMSDRMDENYVIYSDFDAENRFCLHLFCVNPAGGLQECLDRGRSAVFFSATLLPIRYYKKLLSTRTDNYAVYADSVFRREQRLLFVASDVSSLYTRRNQTEFQKIASYIRMTAEAKRGNYIVFFPSYQYLENVRGELQMQEESGTEYLIQSAHMNEAEREAFIDAFSAEREHSMTALCVLGGVFSEGIDLKRNRLIGVLIVGTGLPQICSRREVLKSCYNGEKEGFHYAYQYPGMNKVLQAAGRVIRTAEDCGVIGLLDERFLRNDYRVLFPREWSDYRACSLRTLPGMLEEFWKQPLMQYRNNYMQNLRYTNRD